MSFPAFSFTLPTWIDTFLGDKPLVYPTLEAQMELVIALSAQNIDAGSGGPFGAAIFNQESGALLAPGVNLVSSTNCALCHAEMVAIAIAQQKIGHFDLGGSGLPPFRLVASTEPCVMCFGGVLWSGVRELVCGARDADARAIGFDEGPKRDDWPQTLIERGINVHRDVLREKAGAVLLDYQQRGGLIYNGRLSNAD